MSERVRLETVDGVGPVAVKTRAPGEPEALLDHEARVLEGLDLPGVVRLVERRDGPEPALVTHYVGTHSLLTAPPLAPDEAIVLLWHVAEIVADLHRHEVTHGAIDASHVLLGPGRRPVLCGFSGATAAIGRPVDSPSTADDVEALGRLITRELAGRDDLEPIPSRRRRTGPAWVGYRTRAMLTLADHCQAEEPRARPSAASLAATIGDLVGDRSTGAVGRGRLHGLVARGRGSMAIWSGRLTSAVRSPIGTTGAIAGALAIGIVVASIAVASRSSSSSPAATPAGAVPDGAAADAAGPGPTPPTTIPPPALAEGCTPEGRVDTDGDGCGDGDPVVEGNEVLVGADRFVVGRSSDRLLVGDWDCDGLSTVVLVRAEPAGLWHFPRWADLEAAPVSSGSTETDVASAVAIEQSNGCAELVVETGDGRTTTVEISS